MPLQAYADTYDIATGSIIVKKDENAQTVTQVNNSEVQNKEDNNPVITSNNNEVRYVTLTINASENQEAEVTIKDLIINNKPSPSFDPAIHIKGGGDVRIELDGTNNISSASDRGGINKVNAGILTITDEDKDGSLTAIGGYGGAGIGGGYSSAQDGTGITIEGGTITAIGNNGGAGIGGGRHGNGEGITIVGGTVTAIGHNGGAGIGGGIGGGINGTGTGISISNDAHVMVAGGSMAAAIGSGERQGGAIEFNPDISLLSTDGYIQYYPAGTTAEQIKNGTVQPTKTVQKTDTSPEDPITGGGGSTQVEPPIAGNPVIPQESSVNPFEVPTAVEGGITNLVHSSSGEIYEDNTEVKDIPTSSEEFATFLAATNAKLEAYIKNIESLMAAGDTEGLNALVSKGITLETGNWVCFNKKTYALIEKISDLGAPVIISFAYKGHRYSTVIPGKAGIRPLDLCNEEGYCGFLNLIKYYGGGEK
ncbi:hypothetical protein D6856_04495 [Butyrivibrio sp. XB500-5]|nr:hypothetical protein D6856_04495 [Butyrivibrio sp. XB500-5]